MQSAGARQNAKVVRRAKYARLRMTSDKGPRPRRFIIERFLRVEIPACRTRGENQPGCARRTDECVRPHTSRFLASRGMTTLGGGGQILSARSASFRRIELRARS